MNSTHQILLITGNYEIMKCVWDALEAPLFDIEVAFNHREAFYYLDERQFELILIDASMQDHHTGTKTLDTLIKCARSEPIVTFSLKASPDHHHSDAIAAQVTILSPNTVYQTVIETMHPGSDSVRTVPIRVKSGFPEAAMDEINTLFDLSKSLTEVLDLDEVLNRIVVAARHLTRAEESVILLPEGDNLQIRAWVGINAENASEYYLNTVSPSAIDVFESGQPTLNNISAQEFETTDHKTAVLLVPMTLKYTVIGVLGVSNRRSQESFVPHHQRLMTNLVSFASIAIENANIHRESLRRAHELEMLVAASETLNTPMALAESLPNICHQLARVLEVGYVEINKCDLASYRLDTIARYWHLMWPLDLAPTFAFKEHPYLYDALHNTHNTYQHFIKHKTPTRHFIDGVQEIVTIPLHTGAIVHGMIQAAFVESTEDFVFPKMVPKILEELLNFLEERVDGLSQRYKQQILDLLDEAKTLLHANWCDLVIQSPDGRGVSVIARTGTGVWISSTMDSLDLRQQPAVYQSLNEIQPILEHRANPTQSLANMPLLKRSQTQAVLAIPFIQRGQPDGFMVFGSTEPGRLASNHDIDMARAVVGQAATALENATLVHELELSLQNLRTAQDRLVQTARLSAMGELASVVAHQINNPLTTIIVDTELMLLDTAKDSPNYSALEAIARTGKRAANVTRRLLAIARPIDPDASPDYVDIIDSVRGVLALLQAHIEYANIEVNVDFPAEQIPPISAVKGQLEDIWINLLINAYDSLVSVDYVGRLGIEVHYISSRKAVQVIIWDNGPGIPEKIHDKIFSPFFTTKPVGEGTGLGLHICHEVAEAVGGSIDFESIPYELTRFVVDLPVTET